MLIAVIRRAGKGSGISNFFARVLELAGSVAVMVASRPRSAAYGLVAPVIFPFFHGSRIFSMEFPFPWCVSLFLDSSRFFFKDLTFFSRSVLRVLDVLCSLNDVVQGKSPFSWRVLHFPDGHLGFYGSCHFATDLVFSQWILHPSVWFVFCEYCIFLWTWWFSSIKAPSYRNLLFILPWISL